MFDCIIPLSYDMSTFYFFYFTNLFGYTIIDIVTHLSDIPWKTRTMQLLFIREGILREEKK